MTSTTPRVLRGDRCRCSPLGGCGEWFNSTAAFERHRKGTLGVSRRCRTPDEMLAAGMSVSSAGRWITSARPTASYEAA